MVTGVETAGLVLAAFPIIVSLIESYRKGLEPFRIWAKYCRELKLLRKVIDTESVKLLNTCEQLLEPLVPQKKLATMIMHPGSPSWKDPALHSRLESLLGVSYQSFVGALDDIKEVLDELNEKLDVALDPRVCLKTSVLGK